MTELERLIADTYTALQEERAARIQRKLKETQERITQEIQTLNHAITEQFGTGVAYALQHANGTFEAWMVTLQGNIAFTPCAWEENEQPHVYTVFAFDYRGCRLHLSYAGSKWNLELVEPIRTDHITYTGRRTVREFDSRTLLIMIDELTRFADNGADI